MKWEISADIITIFIVFLSLKIDFVFASSTDPDEMPHYTAFHLALHCLLKYPFRGLQSTKINLREGGGNKK